MEFHRDFTYAQFSTDLLIQQAGDNECHHLPFPKSK